MPEGLVTVVTTADMQTAYGDDPGALEKYCIVRTFEGAEADSIMGGTFKDYFSRFEKLALGGDTTSEQIEVNGKIREYLANDQGQQLLDNPASTEITVAKIICYSGAGDQARPITSPRTGKPFAVTPERVKDFLTTIEIEGKEYNHLDMVVESYFIVGK
jgi:hypothetical protein